MVFVPLYSHGIILILQAVPDPVRIMEQLRYSFGALRVRSHEFFQFRNLGF